MNHEERTKFSIANGDAMTLHWAASHHYTAARCLLWHGHSFDGIISSQQAIEKELKCAILLKKPNYNVAQHSHRVAELLPVLEDIGLPSLNSFKSYCQYLQDIYPITRYPSDSEAKRQWSTNVDNLDELMLYVQDIMPWPDEVFRYCNYGPFYQLCRRDGWQPLLPNIQWAGDDWSKPGNKAYFKIRKRIEYQFYQLWTEVYEKPPPGYSDQPPKPI